MHTEASEAWTLGISECRDCCNDEKNLTVWQIYNNLSEPWRASVPCLVFYRGPYSAPQYRSTAYRSTAVPGDIKFSITTDPLIMFLQLCAVLVYISSESTDIINYHRQHHRLNTNVKLLAEFEMEDAANAQGQRSGLVCSTIGNLAPWVPVIPAHPCPVPPSSMDPAAERLHAQWPQFPMGDSPFFLSSSSSG